MTFMPPQVFISHSHDVADSFVAAARGAVGNSLADDVGDADEIVLLVGCVHDEIESQFLTAGERGIPRLVFLLDPAPSNEPATEIDPRQAGFRIRLLDSGAVTAVVNTPDTLSDAVTTSLYGLRSPVTFSRLVRKMPPLPANFAGRETELARLRDMLHPARPANVVLTGEAGVGKSALAAAYAHRFADEYDVVWWVRALSPSLVNVSIDDLRATNYHLPRHTKWLLIVDDAPEFVRIPHEGFQRGHVIVTSRLPRSDDCLRLEPDAHSAIGPESWSAALERLDGTARQLVILGAWIAPTPLSISRMAAHPEHLPEPLRNPEGLAKAAAVLRHENLALVDTDTITPHALLAEWLRDQTKEDQPTAGGWLAVALEVLSHADGTSRHGRAMRSMLLEITAEGRPTGPAPEIVGRLLDQLASRDIASPSRLRDTATRYLRAAMAEREREAMESLRAEGNPAGVAAALRELGRLPEALAEDEQQWAALKQTLGDDHADTLAQAVNLATTRHDAGDHEHGLALATDTLTRARRSLGDDHPVTLAAMLVLGDLYRETDDYGLARMLDDDLLRRCDRLLGPYHPRTLQAATALASDLAGLGEHEAARDLNRHTHNRYVFVLGDDHPDTLACAVNLAADYAEQGRWDLACSLGTGTLDRYRRTLGDEHPDTRRCRDNLQRDLAARDRGWSRPRRAVDRARYAPQQQAQAGTSTEDDVEPHGGIPQNPDTSTGAWEVGPTGDHSPQSDDETRRPVR